MPAAGVPWLVCGARRSAIRRSPSRPRDSAQIGYSSFAGLRPAVPTRGRRSPSRPRDSMQIGGTRHGGPHIGVASVIGAGFALPRDAGRRPALRRPRDSARSAMRERRADAGRRISAGTPTGSVTRRHGNADLWSAQPAGGGRREGPRLRGWVASRPGPRRSASAGRTPFAALRAAVPAPTGRTGQRSAFQAVPAILRVVAYCRARKNKWQRTSGSLPAISGRFGDGGSPTPTGLLDWSGKCPRPRTAPDLVWRSVVGAGFALPRDRGGSVVGAGFALTRDAGLKTGAPGRPCDSRVVAYCRARTKQMAANLWFAAGDFGGMCERGDSPLSQDGARRKPRADAGAGATGFGVTRSAGFALTRDAGRRPALLGRRRWGGLRAPARCRSETGAPWGGVVGAGFALPRDAGRRPALLGRRCWGGFRAPARCRSETGAPRGGVVGAGFALTRDAGRRPALLGRRRWGGFRAPARCRSETGAPCVVGAGFALPRDAGLKTGAPGRPCDSTRTSERAKNKWQRTSGSLPAISGECVKGGILPFHN